MWSILGSLFTGIISGGATGLLGVVVQRFFDLKNKEADVAAKAAEYAHDLDMKRADAEIMAQEWAGRTSVATIEGQSQENVADAQAFSASFAEPAHYSVATTVTPNQNWAFVILDLLRGTIRPLLTVYLCVLTTLVYFQARALLKDALPVSDAIDLVRLIVGTVLYLTTTCVLWWFGTRNKQAAPKIQKDPK